MPANYTTGSESILVELNDKTALELLPVMLYVGILMVVGVVGNILVCFVFFFRLRRTTQHFLIVCLAIFDLGNAAIAIPLEIINMRDFFLFDNEKLCRLLRFTTHYCTMASVEILLIIAIDRYWKVCRPFERQISLPTVKMIFVLVLLVAFVFASPALALYGIRSTPVSTLHPNTTVVGRDCATANAVKDTTIPLIYNSILSVSFVSFTVTLAIIYLKIWSEIRRLYHSAALLRSKHGLEQTPMSDTCTAENVMSHEEYDFGRDREKISNNTSTCLGEDTVPDITIQNATLGEDTVSDITIQNATLGEDTVPDITIQNATLGEDTVSDITIQNATLGEDTVPDITIQNATLGEDTVPDITIQNATSPKTMTSESFLRRESDSQQLDLQVKQSCSQAKVKHSRIQTQQSCGESSGDWSSSSKHAELSSLNPVDPRQKGQNVVLSPQLSRLLKNKRQAIISCTVTVAFFVSLLHNVSLITARVTKTDFDRTLRGASLVVYMIFLKSHFLYSASNPIIYGVLNKQFRSECARLLRKIF